MVDPAVIPVGDHVNSVAVVWLAWWSKWRPVKGVTVTVSLLLSIV